METKQVSKVRNGWPSLFDTNARLFDQFFPLPTTDLFGKEMITTPAVNITETEKEFRLSVAAPGLVKDDFKVEVTEGMLTVSAEKEKEEKEEKDNFNRREYNYNSWMRSFNLPKEVDAANITAECKNGELVIKLPKNEMKDKNNAKSITIN